MHRYRRVSLTRPAMHASVRLLPCPERQLPKGSRSRLGRRRSSGQGIVLFVAASQPLPTLEGTLLEAVAEDWARAIVQAEHEHALLHNLLQQPSAKCPLQKEKAEDALAADPSVSCTPITVSTHPAQVILARSFHTTDCSHIGRRLSRQPAVCPCR